MRNPFGEANMGSLYDEARPSLQVDAVQRIAELVGGKTVQRALDIACGTGQSSLALADIADAVVAVDVAAGMLSAARRHPSVDYVLTPAEHLPFDDDAFDAATVASGVHWFDQEAFFVEARRVLTASGWLALYDHYFLGEMEEISEFADWTRGSYATRYPPPTRGPRFDKSSKSPIGFDRLGDDGYLDVVEMTHDGLVDYLLTQSNTTSAVVDGRESRAAIRKWLSYETRAFFDATETRNLRFWTVIVCFSVEGDDDSHF
jgi:SAM-dependent methyltransferase